MINEEILREINSLPPEAQRQIEDFIAFLRERYKNSPPKNVSDFETEAFVGMWRERDEMSDSSAWVRNLRETHWNK